jgi:hypothetical protein
MGQLSGWQLPFGAVVGTGHCSLRGRVYDPDGWVLALFYAQGALAFWCAHSAIVIVEAVLLRRGVSVSGLASTG